MMRIVLVLFILLTACHKSPVPKGIFPPDKMEAVLYDVVRADELNDFSVIQDSTYRNFNKRTALYDSIFNLHNISKEDFRKSMAYYQGRPDLLKEIFEELFSKTDTTGKTPIVKPTDKPQRKLIQDSFSKQVQ